MIEHSSVPSHGRPIGVAERVVFVEKSIFARGSRFESRFVTPRVCHRLACLPAVVCCSESRLILKGGSCVAGLRFWLSFFSRSRAFLT